MKGLKARHIILAAYHREICSRRAKELAETLDIDEEE